MIGDAWLDFIFGIYVTVAILGFPLALASATLFAGWLIARNKVLRTEVTELVDRMFAANKSAKKEE